MAAPTVVAPQNVLGPFDAVTAGLADFVWTAGTITDGNTYTVSGRELLLVWNSGAADAHTIDVVSTDDEHGRAENITAYSMAAGDFAAFGCGLTNQKGWMSSAKTIRITVNHAEVKVAILRLPAGYGR